jgi:radical SAM superfamily enzyme YgiQ (UPF0313 family)
MRALVVYPEWPDTYWSFKHALPVEGSRSAFRPMGLLMVASLLPREWEKRLVDVNVRKVKDADLAWADVVLVSPMLVQRKSVLKILACCRARGIRTVVGGPITSCMDDLALYADHVVVGEAKVKAPELAAVLDRGEAKPLYRAGAGGRAGTRLHAAAGPRPDRSEELQLDGHPAPARLPVQPPLLRHY